METVTKLDAGSRAGAEGDRPCYICPECGVTYDAAPGDPAPECDCGEAATTIDYEDTRPDWLPDGWSLAVATDGRVMLCSPGTSPRELGEGAWGTEEEAHEALAAWLRRNEPDERADAR